MRWVGCWRDVIGGGGIILRQLPNAAVCVVPSISHSGKAELIVSMHGNQDSVDDLVGHAEALLGGSALDDATNAKDETLDLVAQLWRTHLDQDYRCDITVLGIRRQQLPSAVERLLSLSCAGNCFLDITNGQIYARTKFGQADLATQLDHLAVGVGGFTRRLNQRSDEFIDPVLVELDSKLRDRWDPAHILQPR